MLSSDPSRGTDLSKRFLALVLILRRVSEIRSSKSLSEQNCCSFPDNLFLQRESRAEERMSNVTETLCFPAAEYCWMKGDKMNVTA